MLDTERFRIGKLTAWIILRPYGRGSDRRSRVGLFRSVAVAGGLMAIVLAAAGCDRSSSPPATAAPRVTVYCSVDEQFANKVLSTFEDASGIAVDAVFDSEAGKTTGLVNRIIQEARSGRVRADVFWSSELFNTIRLARMGLLAPYDSPAASDIPAPYRDAKGRWTAMAARGRVIAYVPARTKPLEVPGRWANLADPAVASRTAIANPLFGTTRGHVAAMFALWGHDDCAAYLSRLREGGVTVVDGNSSAVRALLAGQVDFAATDTDDVWVAQRAGYSIDLVYPDMGTGGTLWIPCSVAIVKGGPAEDPARKLVDYLVSAKVERMLAQSDSRNIPVRPSVRRALGLTLPPLCSVAFDAIADAIEPSQRAVREILIR